MDRHGATLSSATSHGYMYMASLACMGRPYTYRYIRCYLLSSCVQCAEEAHALHVSNAQYTSLARHAYTCQIKSGIRSPSSIEVEPEGAYVYEYDGCDVRVSHTFDMYHTRQHSASSTSDDGNTAETVMFADRRSTA
jgi:hypothetical protein